MVFHRGNYDLVAFFNVFPAPGTGYQVDAFGSAAYEDEFVFAACVEEEFGLRACLLVGGGGALRQLVYAAVNVGTVHFVKAADGIDHREGFLRSGGGIQIHQGFAVDFLLQDREILADLVHVETGGYCTT